MLSLRTAWSKLQWSVVQRRLRGTLRFALVRSGKESTDKTNPLPHPFDQRYGVDTSGLIGGSDLRSGHKHDQFNTAYYGMAPSRFQTVMELWITDESHPAIGSYSFIDLGCGKGRVVMMASAFGLRQVVGVELHPALAAIAEANVATWSAAGRAVCPIRIVCQDATEFVLPEGPCLLYLFNPFASPVMKQLIERIENDFAQRQELLDIIYFNPEAGELLEAHSGFELLWTGTVAMSEEDAAVDRVASAEDICSVYRWVGSV
jgi:Methyltransferase domain